MKSIVRAAGGMPREMWERMLLEVRFFYHHPTGTPNSTCIFLPSDTFSKYLPYIAILQQPLREMENSELLERFLPGYRIVCRIFARYLGIDLTDFMSKAFVLFALLKSVQYLWSSLSGILGITLTSSIEVPEGRVYDDVLHWVSRNVLEGRGVGVRALSVASSNLEAKMTTDGGKIVQGKKCRLACPYPCCLLSLSSLSYTLITSII